MDDACALRRIRLVHTLVWAMFAASIVAIPVFTWRRDAGVAGSLVCAFVAIEACVFPRIGCVAR